MSRLMTRTARLREIEEILFLETKGVRVADLAYRLGVNRRTIYRDLDFLRAEGVPIWQDDGRYGINRARYLATVHLSLHESIALVLAGLLLSRTVDENNPHVAAALRKLSTTLPRPLKSHLERAAERVQGQGEGQRQVAVLETLAEGWASGHHVRIGYRSPRSGVLRQRILAPYALEPTQSGIYAIGHDDWADDVRTFKLDRLEEATLLETTFSIPDEFDLEAFLLSGWRIMSGESVQEVMLRFTSEAAPHVLERRWHPSQWLRQLADGRCVLHVWVAEPVEMCPWIRSWGSQVEVVAPDWLREQIAADVRAAADQYEANAVGL